MKVAIVAPHMFMHKDIVHNTIFAPGVLVIDLINGLKAVGVDVTFISPNYQIDGLKNINGDLNLLNEELSLRNYSLFELLQKHPLLFSTLGRQIQAELIAKTFEMANTGDFDLVHIYMNEEELAMVFARFCKVPVIFTHHEPFNFLTKYRTIFPKYKDLNWLSISLAQRKSMPEDTNWIGNIYHGIEEKKFEANLENNQEYFAYFGRIIEPKGVHLAIAAAKKAGVKLKIAGKHYSGESKDTYWNNFIEPEIDNDFIQYVGFVSGDKSKQDFLGKAKALIMPSTWDEPFGVVMIEAMANGTPIIGFDSGAIPELIEDARNGILVKKTLNQEKNIKNLSNAIKEFEKIDRKEVRKIFEEKFTLSQMVKDHLAIYKKLLLKSEKIY